MVPCLASPKICCGGIAFGVSRASVRVCSRFRRVSIGNVGVCRSLLEILPVASIYVDSQGFDEICKNQRSSFYGFGETW